MARYYRTYNESATGDAGYFYCEVIDHMITRIVQEFNDCLYWSTPAQCKNEMHEFTDQPEFEEKDIPDLIANFGMIELSEAEFAAIWQRAQD